MEILNKELMKKNKLVNNPTDENEKNNILVNKNTKLEKHKVYKYDCSN